MKVALLVIATNRYVEYVKWLTESVATYFFTEDDLRVHLFTDDNSTERCWVDGRLNLWIHPIPSWGFPEASLLRYHLFNAHWGDIDADFVYYCDVDMVFVQPVAHDVLPVTDTGLVGVLHRGFLDIEGTYETRPESTAYVSPGRRRRYYAGGFNGGRTEDFMAMSHVIAEAIDEDRRHGIMSIWHDESHLNHYFSRVVPTTLGPEYCWPEEVLNRDAKLLCLVKPEGFR